DRRAIRHGLVESLPHVLARSLVQSHYAGPRLGSREEDQQIVVDQRGGPAPQLPYLIFLVQKPLPENITAHGIKAADLAIWIQSVEPVGFHNRSRRGTRLLTWDVGPIGIDCLVGIGPKRLAGPFVKAKHSLLGLGTHELGVGEIDPALGNDRARPS